MLDPAERLPFQAELAFEQLPEQGPGARVVREVGVRVNVDVVDWLIGAASERERDELAELLRQRRAAEPPRRDRHDGLVLGLEQMAGEGVAKAATARRPRNHRSAR